MVTCGFAPAALTAHPAHLGIRQLPAPGALDFLDLGHDLLSGGEDGNPVLLIHHAQRSNRHRVGMLRAAVRRSGVVSVGLACPLTGLAAHASYLSSLATKDVPVGVAVSYLLEHHGSLLPTYAAATSVASLDLPFVKLRHHMLSWIPGTTFSIALEEQTRITTSQCSGPPKQVEGVDLVVAGQVRYAVQLSQVTPSGVVQRFEEPIPEGGPLWWGSARFFEQTIVPRDVGDTVAAISSAKVTRCVTCGRQSLGSCPFCTAREGHHS